MDPMFEALLSLIPSDRIDTVMAYLYALSMALAVVKWAVAKWVPLEWRVWTDGPIKLLDVIAANSRAMEHRPVKEPKRRSSQPVKP